MSRGIVLACVLGVIGFVISVLGILWARADDIARSHLATQQAQAAQDAVRPCAQATDRAHNVQCIVDSEIARTARTAADARASQAARTTRDVCVVLAALAPTAGTRALRHDLRCDQPVRPAPRPTQTVVVVSPVPGPPATTPTGTGRPTPSAARSGTRGRTSPSASPSPSPSASPSPTCVLPPQLLRKCP